MGDTLTSVLLTIQGDFSLAVPVGSNTLNYTFTLSGGSPAFTPTTVTEAVVGSGGSSSSYSFTGCPEVGINNQAACTDALALVGPATYASVVVTGVGSWAAGSVGLTATGFEDFGVTAVFTYGPTITTPEPASLLLIGGGLIGLAVLVRRKVKA